MPAIQLLARAPAAGESDLEILQPDPGVSVQAYETYEASAPGRPIRLGTETLLRIAVTMRDFGYSTTHIQVVGQDFRVSTVTTEMEQLADTALDLLRHDSLDGVLAFFVNLGRGLYVTEIELRSNRGDGRLTIRRNGWLTVHNSNRIEEVKLSFQETSRRVGIV